MFKRLIFIIFIGIIILIAASYFLSRKEIQNLLPEYQIAGQQNEKNIEINGQKLIVEIADEPYEQTRGLSDRKNLDQNKGMLFLFSQPLIPPFWMKDMHFALDILWINADGIIISITKDISPNTYPKTFQPPSPVKYVLEVNAGWANRNKIKTGDGMIIKN